MIEININSDEFVSFTEKLERLSSSVLPKVVRGTLNGLALDVKKTTMPYEAGKAFVGRQKNFFKASSTVNFARGSSIEQMESQVGFSKLGDSDAVENLEKQEHGGKIKGRSFIPLNSARKGRNIKNAVEARYRIGRIKNVKRASRQRGSKGEKIIKAVLKANKGGYVIGENGIVFRVERLSTARNVKFKLKAIYSFEKGRSVNVKATHFMEKATNKTTTKGPEIFKKEAEYRFKKHFN